jgi:hypothetical protein
MSYIYVLMMISPFSTCRKIWLSEEALNKTILQSSIPSGFKQVAEKLVISGEIGAKRPSAAKAGVDFSGIMWGLKPPPPSVSSSSATCKALIDHEEFGARDPDPEGVPIPRYPGRALSKQ